MPIRNFLTNRLIIKKLWKVTPVAVREKIAAAHHRGALITDDALTMKLRRFLLFLRRRAHLPLIKKFEHFRAISVIARVIRQRQALTRTRHRSGYWNNWATWSPYCHVIPQCDSMIHHNALPYRALWVIDRGRCLTQFSNSSADNGLLM